jgi:hypothetical protein
MRNHVQHPDELRLEMALGLRIAPLGIGRRDGIQRLGELSDEGDDDVHDSREDADDDAHRAGQVDRRRVR